MNVSATNGTSTRIPIRPYTTDGTAASSRTTGSRMRLSHAGANSTMKTAVKTLNTRPMTTAPAVVMNVPTSSGSAPISRT